MQLAGRNLKTWWVVAAAVALAAVVAGALYATGTIGSKDSSTSLAEEGSSGGVSADDGTPIDGTTDNKATPAGAGTGGTSGSDSQSDDSTSGVQTPRPAEYRLRIMWWNETQSKDPKDFELRIGDKTWSPANTGAASETGVVGPLPWDTELELVVFPDGPDGKSASVKVKFESPLQSDSEKDAVHVEVGDDYVRILGNAVDNFDRTFARF